MTDTSVRRALPPLVAFLLTLVGNVVAMAVAATAVLLTLAAAVVVFGGEVLGLG